MNLLKRTVLFKSVRVNTDIVDRIPSLFTAPCVHCMHNQTFIREKYIDLRAKNYSRGHHFYRRPTQNSPLQTKLLQHDLTPKTQFSGFNPQFIQHVQNKKVLKGKEVYMINHRELSLTPKDILDSSPKGLQPYMRLIRFDKPIGRFDYFTGLKLEQYFVIGI